jgi:serine protease Do
MEKRIPSIGILVLVALCSAMIGMFIATSFNLTSESEARPFWKEGAQEGASHVMMPSLRTLARVASPTVVNIKTTKKLDTDEMYKRFETPGGQNEMFDDFFRKFFEQIPEQDLKQRSLGSGFIISADGYILTNNHVISGADEIYVTLTDNGDEYRARVVGKDDSTDISLIKIESKKDDFPVAVLGNSDTLDIGDWVIAIGNPFGFGHTLTQGIVSAKARVIGAGPYDSFIQTDAAINPGNSGGPLINMNGEVVGINTAIISSGQGIGFAIPINMAKQILQDLKDKGEVARGWLGIAIQEVTPEIARAVGLEKPYGAMITDIYPGDPADRAGLRKGDIILSINNQEIADPRALTRLIGSLKPEDTVSMVIWRESRKVTIGTRLEKRSEEHITAGINKAPLPGAPGRTKDRLGLVIQDITPEIRRQMNLEEDTGVLVLDIDPEGSAADSRIQKLDVIREVRGLRVRNTRSTSPPSMASRKASPFSCLSFREASLCTSRCRSSEDTGPCKDQSSSQGHGKEEGRFSRAAHRHGARFPL